VAYWVEQMSQDADESADRHREELLNAELARFQEHVIGFNSGDSEELTWCS